MYMSEQECFENLANAIVLQAIKDYVSDKKKFERKKKKCGDKPEEQEELKVLESKLDDIRRWFGSKAYYSYTGLAPEVILEACEKASKAKRKVRLRGADYTS